MAKLFLIIICVCTACIHLAWSQMIRKSLDHPHKWIESDVKQTTHQHGNKFRSQDRHFAPKSSNAASDLESQNQLQTKLNSAYSQQNDGQQHIETNQNYKIKQLHRSKRHAGHSHDTMVHSDDHIEMNSKTERFIEKLFQQFSNGDSKTMNLIQFENMVKHLGLERLIDDKQLNNAPHSGDTHNTDDHSHDAHSNETVNIFANKFITK